MGKEKLIGYSAKTKDEAKHICSVLHSRGEKWSDGSSYSNQTNWHYYTADTVYVTFMNKFVNKEWCDKNGVKINPYNSIKKYNLFQRLILKLL